MKEFSIIIYKRNSLVGELFLSWKAIYSLKLLGIVRLS